MNLFLGCYDPTLSFFVVFLFAASLKSALSVARPRFDHLPFDLLTDFFLSSYKILWQTRLLLSTSFALVWAGYLAPRLGHEDIKTRTKRENVRPLGSEKLQKRINSIVAGLVHSGNFLELCTTAVLSIRAGTLRL